MKENSYDEILDLFLQEMRRQLSPHLKQVILFGSRARGDFTAASDYDCLAVVDALSQGIEDSIDDIAGELLYRHDVVFSIFPITEEKYRRHRYDPFLMNIRQEGVVL